MAKNAYHETIIAQGVRIEGEFIAEGDITIEGAVRGTITTSGNVQIGEHAKVEADIRAQNAIIAGEVRGTMHILGKLEMLPSSTFVGDMMVEVLSVGAGAKIHGTVRMGEDALAEEVPQTPTKKQSKRNVQENSEA